MSKSKFFNLYLYFLTFSFDLYLHVCVHICYSFHSLYKIILTNTFVMSYCFLTDWRLYVDVYSIQYSANGPVYTAILSVNCSFLNWIRFDLNLIWGELKLNKCVNSSHRTQGSRMVFLSKKIHWILDIGYIFDGIGYRNVNEQLWCTTFMRLYTRACDAFAYVSASNNILFW